MKEQNEFYALLKTILEVKDDRGRRAFECLDGPIIKYIARKLK